MNIQHQSATSPNLKLIYALGLAGLIPFLVSIAAPITGLYPQTEWLEIRLSYGATILSFVGAIHWGIAMSQPEMSRKDRNIFFIWSVVPALIGWYSLGLKPVEASTILALGFILHLIQDYRLQRKALTPSWYFPLRMLLTIVATICLILGLFI